MSMNKENRQSHQRTQDVRWKPNAGENHLLQYVSIFFQEILFTMILYWCSPLPVRRLQPAESYNSLSFSSLSWKGATTPYFFSWRIKWSTSIQQIQSTTDIRSVITETTQNTLWTEIYSQQIILRQGRIFFFLWPATGRSIPSAVLRADALFLFAFLWPTHPATLSRRVFRFRDAPNTTVAPRPLPQRRTWAFTVLRPGALSLHWICVPSDIEDKRTSEPTQTLRSTDLIMRHIDHSPLEDSPL